MNATITKHTSDCKMAFGKKDPTCGRCQELMAGAPARAGWQAGYYAAKSVNDRRIASAFGW